LVNMLRMGLTKQPSESDGHDLPLSIKSLRRRIRNEGSHVLQPFTATPIDLTTVANFPLEHLADFEKATDPMIFLHRNIYDLTQHIFSLPHLAQHMILSPAIATRYNEVVYDDLHTSQWWSDLQRSVGDDDVVILPLMLSSDATLVSGNGKNKAWPIYMTIGNVPKGVRYKKEYGACRVLGYLPVINVLPEYAGKPWISKCKMAIYHHCMKLLMAPFSGSTSQTKFFQGPFGSVYKCLPRLATYSADYPEQNLLALTKSWTNGYGCPRCTVESSEYRKGVNGVAVRRSNSNMIQFASTEDFGTMIFTSLVAYIGT
ncbi:hypothetical protein, partial, partial [Absidia glauca]